MHSHGLLHGYPVHGLPVEACSNMQRHIQTMCGTSTRNQGRRLQCQQITAAICYVTALVNGMPVCLQATGLSIIEQEKAVLLLTRAMIASLPAGHDCMSDMLQPRVKIVAGLPMSAWDLYEGEQRPLLLCGLIYSHTLLKGLVCGIDLTQVLHW
jgi:hypothetical protein